MTTNANDGNATVAPALSEAPATINSRGVLAWALWDWGSAAFNAVVTTFVFSTFLASQLFVDPEIVAASAGNAKDPTLVAALAGNASLVGWALAIEIGRAHV